MMVASWAVWTFKRIVSGETLLFDGVAIDAKDFRTYAWTEPVKKKNDCPNCGNHGIVFAGDDADLLARELSNPEINVPNISPGHNVLEDHRDNGGEIPVSETPIPFCPGLIIGEDVVAPFNLGLWI